MIPVRGYTDHRVAVLGLGRSGMAAAFALRAGGAIPVCWDDNEEAQVRARAEGFEVANLRHDTAWEDIGTLIVSPGIPPLYPKPHPVVEMAWKHGAVVDNDIGLFFRSYATDDWAGMDKLPRVVAITGSNGKSTTTSLLHHCLKQLGRPTQMGGNIGRGVLDLDPGVEGEVVVLELSSYQTELARALSPDVAIFMNLSSDHLDRHGGHGGYFYAKRRLFAEGGPERSIIGVDEPEGRFLAAQLREDAEGGDPVIRISSGQKLQTGWCVSARKGFLAEWRKGRQIASIDLREITGLPGAHNHQNACAAYAALRTLGFAPRVIETALASYPGLPHRCQTIAEWRGIRFVNDSKATNADAAEQALKAFKNIRWIVGGQAKSGGISGLSGLFDRVAKAYLIGDAAAEFAQTLGDVPHQITQTMQNAVAAAIADAAEGDVVLLAPACASFDQYPDFEKRGEDFTSEVMKHIADG